MKKIISLFLTLTMIFALAACSSNQSTDDNSSESSSSVPATESTEQPSSSDEEEPAETPSEQPETDAKTLVVYFSMPETVSYTHLNLKHLSKWLTPAVSIKRQNNPLSRLQL